MKRSNEREKLIKLVELAIFIAIVVVLQLFGGGIKLGPVSVSLVLIPIVVGGIIIGEGGGALLGLTFGIITLIGGLNGTDVFTAFLLSSGVKGAIITPILCLVKGTAAGYFPALFYRIMKNKSPFWGTVIAAASAPVINTGLFIIGMMPMLDIIADFTSKNGGSISPVAFVIFVCAGFNFIAEFAVNTVLSPALYQFIHAVSGKRV